MSEECREVEILAKEAFGRTKVKVPQLASLKHDECIVSILSDRALKRQLRHDPSRFLAEEKSYHTIFKSRYWYELELLTPISLGEMAESIAWDYVCEPTDEAHEHEASEHVHLKCSKRLKPDALIELVKEIDELL